MALRSTWTGRLLPPPLLARCGSTLALDADRGGGDRRGARSVGDLVGIGVFVSLSAVAAALGAWQLDRRRTKLGQIVERRDRLHADPLPAIPDAIADRHEWSRVRVDAAQGQYHDGRPIRVGPRGGPVRIGGLSKGAGHGHYLVTPLQRHDRSIVLINQGWVSSRRREAFPAPSLLAPDRPLIGVIRRDESASNGTIASTASSDNVWIKFDADAMVRHLLGDSSIEEQPRFVIDLLDEGDEPGTNSGALKRRQIDDYVQFPISPLTHLTYAITWFSLSAALLVLTAIRFRRRRVQRRVE